MQNQVKVVGSVNIDSVWYNISFRYENSVYTVMFSSDILGHTIVETNHEKWEKLMNDVTKDRKISKRGNPYTQLYESIYTIQDKLKVA